MNDTYNIVVSFAVGDKKIAEQLAKLVSSYKDKNPDNVVSGILASFGVTKISEVTYKPHKGENIGYVMLDMECSEEQRLKNIKEARETVSE